MKKHILSICFIHILLACLILVIQLVAFNRAYYHQKFETHQTSQKLSISLEDINQSMDNLLDYLDDTVSSITARVEYQGEYVNMFNDKEIDHMVDVKNLYHNALIFMYSAAISVVISIAILMRDKNRLVLLKESMFEGFLTLLACLGFVVLFAVLDFDSFWTTFHRIFFSNELWLLNPRTDRMIVMLNLDVFMGIVYRIIAYYALCLLAVGGSYYFVRRSVNQI